MISVVIPVGDFPFFIQAVHRNIKETCGNNSPEIIYLTNKMTPRMTNIFNSLDGSFRVATKDFPDRHGVHLKLLDWAVRELELQPWIQVQHLDMFWHGIGWYDIMLDQLDSNLICLATPKKNARHEGFNFKEYKFTIDGKLILRTHDYSGLYNVAALKHYHLSFNWGQLNSMDISPELINAIKSNRIKWLHRGAIMSLTDTVDGSDTIGLEIGIRCQDKIKELEMSSSYVHCGDMFGFLFDMQRTTNELVINRPVARCMRGLPAYSWTSSYLFDKNDMRDLIFPWVIFKKLASQKRFDSEKPVLCSLLERYKYTDNIAGLDALGIQKVQFIDHEIYQKTIL